MTLNKCILIGLLGPICAFIYSIGFYHIVLATQEKYLTIGWFVFLINIFGMILGGTYHIQCAYLGLLSRHENKGAFDEFLKFLKFQAKIVFGIMAIGNIGIAALLLLGFTVFPTWQGFLTPIFFVLLTSFVRRLPKGNFIKFIIYKEKFL